MVYFLILQKEKKVNWKETIIIIIRASLAWGIAYAIIWFTKWVIVDLMYGRDLIKTSLMQAKYRGTGLTISYYDALKLNCNILINNVTKCILFRSYWNYYKSN